MDFDLEEGRGPAEGLVRRHVNGANGDQTDVPLVPEKDISVEEAFEGKVVPEWWQQITVRGVVVSVLLSFLLSIIVMKLNLTTGVIPSLNVSAGLLGFFLIKSYTKVLDRFNFLKVPFTRQENTVIQTCVVSATGIAFSGGFGSYLFAMGPKVYEQSKDIAANTPDTVKDLSIGWIIGFLFLVSFIGLFSVVALRKIMIIDYKLTFPSGTATAVLINGFHTPDGAKIARNQVKYLSKFFTFSFLWSFFQWFYTGGEDCGFSQFPTLGLKARDNMFYFDFSLTYVGAGMICPYIVNVSLFIGAILSWGVMWPLLKTKEGEWYPAGLRPSSMKGLNGYKVFIAISLILGDGLYNFVKIFYITAKAMYTQYKKRQAQTSVAPDGPMAEANETFDDKKRREYFLKDSIPGWMAFTGYLCLAALSVAVVPRIFPPLKWYFIVLCYLLAPVVGFCNAYGCGLTDWSLASTYGKLAIFIFGAWAGKEDGGVLAGLAACGVMMSIVSTAADLTQDFKTGYLTLSSPRTMFVAQVIGTAMGCIIGPSTFWLFYKAFPLGDPTGEYKVPYGITYRNMAVLGVEGFGALPHNCLYLCYGFFAFAIIMNLIRDRVPARVAKYLPLPMAMAIPFYIGAYFAVDMLIGSAIVFVWQFLNKTSADRYSASVASGLLCGDGLWTLPSSILALAKVNPPICMKFLSSVANIKVDNFLAS